jgi:hypothetical protein
MLNNGANFGGGSGMKMRTTKFRPWRLFVSAALLLTLGWWIADGTIFSLNPTVTDNTLSSDTTDTSAAKNNSGASTGTVALASGNPLATPGSSADVVAAAADSCANSAVMQHQLKQILQQRKQQSFQLIQQLQQNGTKAADVAVIIHQLGGDMLLMAQQRADYPANPNTLIRFEQQPRAIPRALALLVLKAALSHNYQPVVAALQADVAPQQLAWHGQTLLTAILAADPNLSPLTLQQLIESGLQPVFADLVAATALQLPVPLVDTLNMAFTGDRQQLWFHQYRRNNLTLQAAADGNVALYDYWQAQGVPALISAADLNAFDVLPFPATEPELIDRLPLIRNFIKQGLLPRQFTSLTSWLLLLPKDDALQLSQQLAGTGLNTASAATDLMHIGSASEISDAIVKTNQQFKQHIAIRQHCNQLYQLGSVLLSLDDADQHYGAALQSRFRLNTTQIEQTIQLHTLQQQLELLLESEQWQAFIRQAQQQLILLPPEQRSKYVLQQLLNYQAPAEVLTMQLQRHYHRHGAPSPDIIAAFSQSQNPKLQAQLRRLRWWQPSQQPLHQAGGN